MLLQEVQNYTNLELLCKQVVEGFITGLHNSPNHGFSVEFAEHKPYNSGQGIKNIDWKLFARSEKLFVKQFEEETNLRCRLILDTSGSMYYPKNSLAKLKFGTLAAGAICSMLSNQRDAFGLSLINPSLQFHSPFKSNKRHYIHILGELDTFWQGNKPKTENNSKDNLVETLKFIAADTHKRSLIVLFTDMLDDAMDDDALWQALQFLRFNKNEVILFHLRDVNTEINLNFEGKETIFKHLETNEEITLNPNDWKENFEQLAKKFDTDVREKCLQFNIDYYDIDVNKDFNFLLKSFYQKRKRMVG